VAAAQRTPEREPDLERVTLALLSSAPTRPYELRIEDELRRQPVSVIAWTQADLAELSEQSRRPRGIVLVAEHPAEIIPLIAQLRGDPRSALIPLIGCVRDPTCAVAGGGGNALVDPTWPAYLDALVDGFSSPGAVHHAISRVVWIATACAALAAPRDASEEAVRRVAILQFLVTRGLGALEPRRDPYARLGFAWPPFDLLAGGDPTDDLGALCGAGLLRHTFHDRILLCPGCGDARLAFREVCRSCDSSNVVRNEVIHHYRCGHVAPEEQFRRGAELVCPGCEGLLRHIGIDYERPAALLFCRACGLGDGEGVTRARCLACGALHAAESVQDRVIFGYQLTRRGEAAARKGELGGGE
jgi:hypothetical protein